MDWKVRNDNRSKKDWWIKVVQHWQVELERQIEIMIQENGYNPNKLVDHESKCDVEMWDCW